MGGRRHRNHKPSFLSLAPFTRAHWVTTVLPYKGQRSAAAKALVAAAFKE